MVLPWYIFIREVAPVDGKVSRNASFNQFKIINLDLHVLNKL